MKDYGSIINRVKKAINTAESKVNGSTVHVKTIDDDISQSSVRGVSFIIFSRS